MQLLLLLAAITALVAGGAVREAALNQTRIDCPMRVNSSSVNLSIV
jgi:hypothetical protein